VNVMQHGGKLTMRSKPVTGSGKPTQGCVCEICYPNGVVVRMSGDMPLEVYRALVLIN